MSFDFFFFEPNQGSCPVFSCHDFLVCFHLKQSPTFFPPLWSFMPLTFRSIRISHLQNVPQFGSSGGLLLVRFRLACMLDAPSDSLMDFTAPFYRNGGWGSERAVTTQLLRGSAGADAESLVLSLCSFSTLQGAAGKSYHLGSYDGFVYQSLLAPWPRMESRFWQEVRIVREEEGHPRGGAPSTYCGEP